MIKSRAFFFQNSVKQKCLFTTAPFPTFVEESYLHQRQAESVYDILEASISKTNAVQVQGYKGNFPIMSAYQGVMTCKSLIQPVNVTPSKKKKEKRKRIHRVELLINMVWKSYVILSKLRAQSVAQCNKADLLSFK
jgi:hypothetical protein